MGPSVEVKAIEGVVRFKSVVGAVDGVWGGVATEAAEVDSVPIPTVAAPAVEEAASSPSPEFIPELTPERDEFQEVSWEEAVIGILNDGIDEFQPSEVIGPDRAAEDEATESEMDKFQVPANGEDAVLGELMGIEEFQLNKVLTPDPVIGSDGCDTRADAVSEAEPDIFHGKVNGGDDPVLEMLTGGREDEFQFNDVPRLETPAGGDFETTTSDVIGDMDEFNDEAAVPGMLINGGIDEFQPENVDE